MITLVVAAAFAVGYPSGCPEFSIDAPRAGSGKTVLAADYGFSVTNELNGAAINRALAAAKEFGASRLELAPGRYFCRDLDSVRIEGFTDFTFDGRGATLVFQRPFPVAGPGERPLAGTPDLRVTGCRRTEIGNFRLDWDWERDPLASFARIAGTHVDSRDNASYVDFDLFERERHPHYGRPLPILTIFPVNETLDGFGKGGLIYCGGGNGPGAYGSRMEWLSPNRIRVWPQVLVGKEPTAGSAKGNRWCVKELSRLPVGKPYRIAHAYYGDGAVVMESNVHITVRDVVIHAARGMGFVTGGDQHHWQLVNVRALPPEGEKRAITTTADFNHVVNSCGWAKFIGVEVAMNQDDLSNFHDKTSAARRIGERRMEITHGRGMSYFAGAVGDEIELREKNYEPTGFTARIVSVEGDRFTLDRDPPEAKFGDFIIFNNHYGTDHLYFRDCIFERGTGRCCVMGNDVTIENCRFKDRNTHAIKLQAAFMQTNWAEGHGCTNVIVRGCTFENGNTLLRGKFGPNKECGDIFVGRNMQKSYSEGELNLPPYDGIVSGILIVSNRFINPHAAIVHVYNASDVTVRDNEVVLPEPDDPQYYDLRHRGGVVREPSSDRASQVDSCPR